jgi:ADP-heptose:LPS heptosyltransferase
MDSCEKLPLIADESVDCVFSSHLLEHIPYENVAATLEEWLRVIRKGGHLCLYVPDEDQYPKVGEKEANPDHKWNVNYGKVVSALPSKGWDLIEFEKRSEKDEYSLWFVIKKTDDQQTFSWTKPKPEKTVAIVRYGAIGDMIQTSSLFPWLKEQGYHITLYCQSGQGYDSVKHDPHVDRFIIQDRNAVPPQFLMEFWDETKKQYDKWINLCESVECTLLATYGRVAWEWPNQLRQKYLDRNYLEWTHELAEIPPPYKPKFYSTPEEKAWAKDKARSYGKINILWSLSGSSGHKVWPHLDAVIAGLMLKYPQVHVTLVGDEFCRILEQGWDNERRVHKHSGKWSIRESMSFAEAADIVIGCETGLLNAAGSMDCWKIVTLSHSSPENLTKHWKNTITLEQPKGVGCAKYHCHQLHGANGTDAWMDCPSHTDEKMKVSLCQYHVTPQMMFEAIESIIERRERMVA